jgi:uncharacterized protein (DUF2147 family)
MVCSDDKINELRKGEMIKPTGSILATLMLTLGFSVSVLAEQTLVGFWQHEDKPVVVEMKPLDGLTQGTVASNSGKPDSVGKRLFRDLAYNADDKQWQGRIFVLKLGEEKDVTVALQNPDQFEMTVKVGFFSKTVSWNRVKKASLEH